MAQVPLHSVPEMPLAVAQPCLWLGLDHLVTASVGHMRRQVIYLVTTKFTWAGQNEDEDSTVSRLFG